jgi:RNA recognition motif-containing protein
MINIYLGNISYSATEGSIKELFEQYGSVSSVKIITDKLTGRSKGFAFVEMSDRAAGLEAIAKLDGTDFLNRNIKVNEARPREERPTTRRSY